VTSDVGRSGDDWIAVLEAHRRTLQRSSVSDRVADLLRQQIIEGSLPPGRRLSEDALGSALAVSRNTLREAFRRLSYERLLTYELNRGVFVRALSADDVVEVYKVRRALELSVVRDLADVAAEDLVPMRAAVRECEQAAQLERWHDVATASMRFHQALVGLAHSSRLDELVRGVLAELRLVFHIPGDPVVLHAPFVARERRILELIEQGRSATDELAAYLEDGERTLLAAFAANGHHLAPR
jgi:DNA-binding GntR family transcriptional regulator